MKQLKDNKGIEQSNEEAAGKMKAAIKQVLGGWKA